MTGALTTKPSWLDSSIILRGIVGSTAHGTNLEGSDDRDEMAVCIEPLHEAWKLQGGFQQYIQRTAVDRTGIKDARSEPGDLDLTVFGLKKFCQLAANGNPSYLLMFYTPEFTADARGTQLRDMVGLFASKEAGKRFIGYMDGQLKRLLGKKGQKRIKRPELEEKFGFDTKYASHVIRLGYQGVEFLETGKLQLPMTERERKIILGIRKGLDTLEDVIELAKALGVRLKQALDESTLPEHPDRPAIEEWMQRVYLESWKARQPRLSFNRESGDHGRLLEYCGYDAVVSPSSHRLDSPLTSALGGSKE